LSRFWSFIFVYVVTQWL